MNTLLHFELQSYFKKIGFYLVIVFLIGTGILAGINFSISLSPDIYKNSSYTIAYMIGFLSLLSILFTTLLASQILFKEKEANFNLILYATPITKIDYLWNRFTLIFGISFFFLTLVILGFGIGQSLKLNESNYSNFYLSFYILPLFLFGFINTLFCSAIICSLSWITQNKLMTYISGLFIYILYMVILLFSGSPLMAKSMPQSEVAMKVSAILDPFGLSGFFMQTNTYTILQKNTELLFPTNLFLVNRLATLGISILFLFIAFKLFSFTSSEKNARKKKLEINDSKKISSVRLTPISPIFNRKNTLKTLSSLIRLDLTYITKSIPFILICFGLLFSVSMEIYGAIEKGIRLPQKYASSGLMANTIIDSFPVLGLIIILFYAHEIIWRSRNSNFHLIENTTPQNETTILLSKWFSLSIIIITLSTLMIFLSIFFQFLYDYAIFDWKAYFSIYIFVSFPLILSAGFICIIQKWINNKYIGLTISSIFILITATSIGKSILIHTLLRIQLPFKGIYSDMNEYGSYLSAFSWRNLFGLAIVLLLFIFTMEIKRMRLRIVLPSILLLIIAYISGTIFTNSFVFENPEKKLENLANYEKLYRKFENIPQPSITDVVTNVTLFPTQNAYKIEGTYTIQNKTNQPIYQILINFDDGFTIKKAILFHNKEAYNTTNQYEIIKLKLPLLPKEKAQFDFILEYQWFPVNGHKSFNSIIENGSFMRISRYYPQFGYLSEKELEKEEDRKKFQLPEATQIRKIEEPKTLVDDFINLKMTISTEGNQTAIGIGELTKQWKEKNRNYFVYETTSPIPFRFAISSAKYAVKTTTHKGRKIEVYYHPSHYENVAHLLKNIKLTLEYCETNFKKYPFKTIRFAEVSSFTKGFAATAYPTSVFMTEDIVFHTNIKADKQQDVINELAGHELSHIWWGNNQINPDDREGYTMLTETLAMYTELMLVEKMHGKKRVMENVNLHLGIYLNERGFSQEQPLYKVNHYDTHICYSKGLVVMYQLSEIIGEQKINLALKNFLEKNTYPNLNPISTDFIDELYAITDKKLHSKIDDLFKRITIYDFQTDNISVKEKKGLYEVSFNILADKYYEDGKGNKTKTAFNDSVEIVFDFIDGSKKTIQTTPFKNNLDFKITLDKKPLNLYFDPNQRFIKRSNEIIPIKQ